MPFKFGSLAFRGERAVLRQRITELQRDEIGFGRFIVALLDINDWFSGHKEWGSYSLDWTPRPSLNSRQVLLLEARRIREGLRRQIQRRPDARRWARLEPSDIWSKSGTQHVDELLPDLRPLWNAMHSIGGKEVPEFPLDTIETAKAEPFRTLQILEQVENWCVLEGGNDTADGPRSAKSDSQLLTALRNDETSPTVEPKPESMTAQPTGEFRGNSIKLVGVNWLVSFEDERGSYPEADYSALSTIAKLLAKPNYSFEVKELVDEETRRWLEHPTADDRIIDDQGLAALKRRYDELKTAEADQDDYLVQEENAEEMAKLVAELKKMQTPSGRPKKLGASTKDQGLGHAHQKHPARLRSS